MEVKDVKNRGWGKVRIKDFGTVYTGNTPSTKIKEYYHGEYKLISPADLTDSKYIITAHKRISEKGLKVSRTLPPNAILVGCIGNVGKIGMTTELSAFNQQINAIICNQSHDPNFIYYLLRYNRHVLEYKAAKVTIPILNKTNFENIELEVPELQEQKAIAKVLTIAQNAIAGQVELIEKLKKLKKSMMQYLFTHGVNNEPTKMTEISEIPESWEVVELEKVCEKPKYGFTDSASQKGNVRFLRITDIQEAGVNWEKVPFCNCPNPDKYLLKDKDIVFARIGATTGKSYLLKNPDNSVFASYLILVRPTKINSVYLYYYFQTRAYWHQIDSQKKNNLKGGINGSVLSRMLVFAASPEEQLKIAITMESMDQKIITAQTQLSAYQKIFKTLLHEFINGERRICGD